MWWKILMFSAAAGLVLLVAGNVELNVPCATDEDCSLNGLCINGKCNCDAGWTTLPHGVNNAMWPGCGYLDFLPATDTVCGPACAFHGGANDNMTSSTWGIRQ